jgi:hypothetical protein
MGQRMTHGNRRPILPNQRIWSTNFCPKKKRMAHHLTKEGRRKVEQSQCRLRYMLYDGRIKNKEFCEYLEKGNQAKGTKRWWERRCWQWRAITFEKENREWQVYIIKNYLNRHWISCSAQHSGKHGNGKKKMPSTSSKTLTSTSRSAEDSLVSHEQNKEMTK